jgi:hypothetical protein
MFISISLIIFFHQVGVDVAIFFLKKSKYKINRKKQKGKMKIKRSKA